VSKSNLNNRQQGETTVQPLDKNGFIPLYFQIQRALMEKIQSGELSEGDPLASEEELSRAYQVSRMTARQALHGLKTNGYAFSEKGRGTFVSRPKLEKNILHLQGFTEDMRRRGMKPSSQLLEQSVISVTEDLMEKLKLDANEKVMRLRRRRRDHRGTPGHTGRVRIADDSAQGERPLHQPDHSHDPGVAYRSGMLALSRRSLSCVDSRSRYHD
jgi:DNA-binding transcriptional regulator YhcF (GntR family)